MPGQNNEKRNIYVCINIFIISISIIASRRKNDGHRYKSWYLSRPGPRKPYEKIREDWYYVSFYSEKKFINFTGFIRASAVEVMREVPEVEEGEKEKPKKQLKELEVVEEVLFESPKNIQVLLEKTNIRAEPDFTSEVIHQVQLGISLRAVGKAGEWYLVNLPPDEEGLIISGYIHQSFVQEIREKR